MNFVKFIKSFEFPAGKFENSRFVDTIFAHDPTVNTDVRYSY
jgi:hypothetical protein